MYINCVNIIVKKRIREKCVLSELISIPKIFLYQRILEKPGKSNPNDEADKKN